MLAKRIIPCLDVKNGRVILGGIQNQLRDLTRTKRIILSACGTAWHAGLITG